SPQQGLHVPVKELVALLVVGDFIVLPLEIAGHNGKSITATKNISVVEAQARGDDVQKIVGSPLSSLQSGLKLRSSDILHGVEARFVPENSIDNAQEPVQVEGKPCLLPFQESLLHLVPRRGPLGADLGKGEVTMREFCSTAIHTVENAYHD